MSANIILIGMPGAGKSTVGIVLAKKLGMKFIDSDLIIQEQVGKLLSEIITEQGLQGFLKIEEDVNAGILAQNTIIATGGSVVYGDRAMQNLHANGICVYLKLSLNEIASRLGNLKDRGVALKDGQTLEALYEERIPLYEKYADVVCDCEHMEIREIVEKIALIYNKIKVNE